MDISMPPSNVDVKSLGSSKENLGFSVREADNSRLEQVSPVPNIDTRNSIAEQSDSSVDMVNMINSQLDALNLGVAFAIDDATNSSIVKVIDRSTSEVIRQYPNDEALKVMQNIRAFLDSVTNSQSIDSKGLTGTLLNEMI